MKAIRFARTGGPEVLALEDIELPPPRAGEIRIRHTAIGVNFIDTYQRSGLYPVPLASGLGLEGAGVVEATGEGVTSFRAGDRAGYCTGPIGSYAEANNVPAERAVKLPAGVTDEIAAASLLKGMTAQYLLKRTYAAKAGQTILFHAAAGGVGLIACQWARAIGATMIGTVGSEEKAQLAREHGCTHVINYRTEDFVARVKEITQGEGCDVVYDSVGKDTFPSSLDCLKPKGMWVSFGSSSGPVPPFDIAVLSAKGSLYATRPTLMSYTARRADLLANAADLFDMVEKGAVKIMVNHTYPLREAAAAHRDLEARKTTGSVVLIP